jgi:acetylserotonin N-methyltransferase
MPTDDTLPDPTLVLDLLQAFRWSKTMFAAVELGVFDALDAKPQALGALAERLSCSVDGLERLVDACVGLGLLAKADGVYANTPVAAAYLCRSSPRRLTGYLNWSNGYMWQLWSHLADAVREGSHRWQQAFGWDGPIFSHFFKDEETKREFLIGMHGFGLVSSPHVARAFDLSGYHTLVDLGGATGHLAIAACERWPNLNAVVFDLPDAVPLAEEIVRQSAVKDRVQIVAGDFFSDPLPAGDVFALGRIVHDWTEAKIDLLFKRIYERLPNGGAILIAEKLLHDDKTGPRWAQMQSLNMLTCTEGKERTLGEYEELLVRAGFSDVRGVRTPSPLDAVMAVKLAN